MTSDLFKIDRSRAFYLLMGAIVIGLVAHLLFIHFQTISFQYPLEYRENTDLWRTYQLSQGENPYAYENLPSGGSVYGIVYPWLGSKLFPFTGIGFPPLRLITFLAILPMIAIFVWYGVRLQIGFLNILLINAVVYAIHLIHPGNFVAMPNTLGMTFFCISALIPPLMRFSTGSLLLACIFSALGFFTKLYFGAGVFYILLYLFYIKDWRRLGVLSIFLLITSLLSALIVIYQLPSFNELTFGVISRHVGWDADNIWPQAKYFARVLFGFVVLLLAARWLCAGGEKNSFSLGNPYFFGFIISSVLLIKMAGAPGQFFLYFQHLLLPFMVMLCIEIIHSSKRKHFIAIVLFLNTLYLSNMSVSPVDLDSTRNSFQQIEKETAILDPKSNTLYNGPLSYYGIKRGITPTEDGQIAGLRFTKGLTYEKYEAQYNLVSENIRTAKYTEIFVDEWQNASHREQLPECYYKAREFELIMYKQRNKTSLWLPKKSCTHKYK